MPFEVQQLHYVTNKKILLHDVSFSLKNQKKTAILGQNGAGKSTLIRLLAAELLPTQGNISLDAEPLNQYSPAQLAQKRAILSQNTEVFFPIKVEELVALGRVAYQESSLHTEQIVKKVMHFVHMEHFAKRWYQDLSGGEKQKVQLARVIAQLWDSTQTQKYLLLDEPITALDIKQQHFVLQTMAYFAQMHNVSLIFILHDINLAIQYADYFLMLKQGKLIAKGTRVEVVKEPILTQLYDCNAQIQEHPITKLPYIFWENT